MSYSKPITPRIQSPTKIRTEKKRIEISKYYRFGNSKINKKKAVKLAKELSAK
jgi:hypothetical protein